MNRWADQCSSDEEDELPERFSVNTERLTSNSEADARDIPEGSVSDAHGEEAEAPPPKREYNFPSEPPFTAYVGNLAYSIIDPQQLAAELTALAKEKLGVDIEIIEPRLMMDHRNPDPDRPKHRGFAYVQVATLEQLQQLMGLNEMHPHIAGRPINLDTAGKGKKGRDRERRGGRRDDAKFDGANFRGGKFQTRSDDKGTTSTSTGERRSLKLQPRSKPLDEKPADSATAGRSDIFGGAKANDTGSWRSNRKPEDKKQHPPKKNNHKREKRITKDKPKPAVKDKPKPAVKDKPKPAAEAPPVAAPPPPKEQKKPEPKKVVNSFEALSMGDSDSD